MRAFLLWFLLVAVFIPSEAFSQYKGGGNDGVAFAVNIAQNVIPAIFKGGSNDGYAFASQINQNASPNIYGGGLNDGVATANATGSNPLPTIYLGGLNDGDATFSIAGQNATAAIYSGGNNDGVSALLVSGQNALPAIYVGSANDGVANAFVANTNALPQIYKGGIDDGTGFILRKNQNLSDPLPVSLIDFTGRWFNEDAILAWETGVETNLDHFELERSGDGGAAFSFVSSIAPNGNGLMLYRYSDIRAYDLPGDFLLYRLKCVDKEGLYKYSAIIRLDKDKSAPIIVAYPNPTRGRLTLALMNVKDLTGYAYVLSTSDGKLINRDVIRDATTSFDLNSYPGGSYHLTLFRDGKLLQHFTILLSQ